MSPVDYDIQPLRVLYADNDTMNYVSREAGNMPVTFRGVYQMARPSESPDGTRVAVQGTKTAHPAEQAADPSELKIFVIDLQTDSATQISPDSATPAESPTWFNTSNKIAYSTFSPTDGVDIHIYDLDQGKETLVIENAGWHGLAVSKDDTKIFVPNSMRVYSTATGELLADLKDEASAGIALAGFTLLTTAGDSNSPFLDGDWSPDGTQLVFDVVEVEHSEPHTTIFTMNIDGTNIQAVAGPLDVNPDFSNNFNFSQSNPIWI